MEREQDEINLTSYALGELEGEAQIAIEARLAGSPEDRRHLEELRAAAAVVTDELSREASPGLEALHYAAIEMRLREPNVQARQNSRRAIVRGRIGFAMSLAASILIVGGAIAIIWLISSDRQQIAQQSTNKLLVQKQVIIPLQQFPVSSTPSGPGVAFAPSSGDPFIDVSDQPISRLPMNMDTTSYADLQRAIADDRLPAAGTTRIEGLINAFAYDDPAPVGNATFNGQIELGQCPWAANHLLARIGIRAKSGAGVVAEEVRTEVAFNKAGVQSYRLIGFDHSGGGLGAGETVAGGHAVVALYEMQPARAGAQNRSDLLTVRIHFRQPASSSLETIEFAGLQREQSKTSKDFYFAAAVAELGMLIDRTSGRGSANTNQVIDLAQAGLGDDRTGERRQFLDLARRAKDLLG